MLLGDIQHSSGLAILKSIIKKPSLNKQVSNYCKEYVICNTCGKPDTVIIKDGRTHVLQCQACGTRRIIKLRKMKVYCKKHKQEDYHVVAVCDEDILGKTFRDPEN